MIQMQKNINFVVVTVIIVSHSEKHDANESYLFNFFTHNPLCNNALCANRT
jgi:hypothetical protein